MTSLTLTVAPAYLNGLCSRVSKNDMREHGPWTRVVCTEHPCSRAVLVGVVYHTSAHDVALVRI